MLIRFARLLQLKDLLIYFTWREFHMLQTQIFAIGTLISEALSMLRLLCESLFRFAACFVAQAPKFTATASCGLCAQHCVWKSASDRRNIKRSPISITK